MFLSVYLIFIVYWLQFKLGRLCPVGSKGKFLTFLTRSTAFITWNVLCRASDRRQWKDSPSPLYSCAAEFWDPEQWLAAGELQRNTCWHVTHGLEQRPFKVPKGSGCWPVQHNLAASSQRHEAFRVSDNEGLCTPEQGSTMCNLLVNANDSPANVFYTHQARNYCASKMYSADGV